jgi:hypothetical protein
MTKDFEIEDPDRDDDAESNRPDTEASSNAPAPKLPEMPSLLRHQLCCTIASNYGHRFREKLEEGIIRLYEQLAPTDVIQSILARHIVGLHNVSFEAIGQFNRGGKNAALLRQALKASELTRQTMELYLKVKSTPKN